MMDLQTRQSLLGIVKKLLKKWKLSLLLNIGLLTANQPNHSKRYGQMKMFSQKDCCLSYQTVLSSEVNSSQAII